MSDEELVKRLQGWAKDIQEGSTAIYAMDLDLKNAASSIEALTEQLEAARADAKEAEAYADELAKDQVDLCRQLIAAEDKLAKAVELVTFASNMDVTDWSEALDVKDQARTTLAEIEGSDAP